MQSTLALEELNVTLLQLVDSMTAGDEVILTRNQQTVAKLVSEVGTTRAPRIPGNCKRMIILAVEDDEHLDGFEEYN